MCVCVCARACVCVYCVVCVCVLCMCVCVCVCVLCVCVCACACVCVYIGKMQTLDTWVNGALQAEPQGASDDKFFELFFNFFYCISPPWPRSHKVRVVKNSLKCPLHGDFIVSLV